MHQGNGYYSHFQGKRLLQKRSYSCRGVMRPNRENEVNVIPRSVAVQAATTIFGKLHLFQST